MIISHNLKESFKSISAQENSNLTWQLPNITNEAEKKNILETNPSNESYFLHFQTLFSLGRHYLFTMKGNKLIMKFFNQFNRRAPKL